MSGNLVCIDAGGYTLLGRLYGCKNSRMLPAALFLRGWSPGVPWTFMDMHARLCAKKLNMVCLSVQFRGMGSPGNANRRTLSDFFEDAAASYDFLKSQKSVDSKRIFAVGESLGAYMASLLSAQRDIMGLLLRAPADFPNDGCGSETRLWQIIKRTKGWRTQAHGPSESAALDAISRFKGDILVVASEKDAIVPRQTADNYLAIAKGETTFILMKNAGHGLISPLRRREFHKIILKWLRGQI
jgi:dipeptidyl aminopeptidase/acylaminoacyl peptidase